MAAFMVQSDARVIDPLLHVVATDFHTSPPNAAIVISSYALPYGLFQLFYGPLGDRVGQLRVMATVMALFAVGTLACAIVPNLWTFIALRLLTGVVAAGSIPLAISYIGDKFPYESRQTALGRTPVLVTSPDLRRYVRAFAERRCPALSVLSFREIEPSVTIRPVETVTSHKDAA